MNPYSEARIGLPGRFGAVACPRRPELQVPTQSRLLYEPVFKDQVAWSFVGGLRRARSIPWLGPLCFGPLRSSFRRRGANFSREPVTVSTSFFAAEPKLGSETSGSAPSLAPLREDLALLLRGRRSFRFGGGAANLSRFPVLLSTFIFSLSVESDSRTLLTRHAPVGTRFAEEPRATAARWPPFGSGEKHLSQLLDSVKSFLLRGLFRRQAGEVGARRLSPGSTSRVPRRVEDGVPRDEPSVLRGTTLPVAGERSVELRRAGVGGL